MKWISYSRCCAVSLVALACLFVSSCKKEGPYGFKVGQEYRFEYYSYVKKDVHTENRVVTDVGSDWVEFKSEEKGIFKITKEGLKAILSQLTLIE